MKYLTSLSISVVFILTAGCASYHQPRTEKMSKALDFSRFETFSVKINQPISTDTAFGPHARDEAREEIAEELEERGFHYVEDGDADFVAIFTSTVGNDHEPFTADYIDSGESVVKKRERIITPSGAVKEEQKVIVTREADPIDVSSRQRLFVLDVVDGRTNALLWRSYMTSDDLELRENDALEEPIERLVSQFPTR